MPLPRHQLLRFDPEMLLKNLQFARQICGYSVTRHARNCQCTILESHTILESDIGVSHASPDMHGEAAATSSTPHPRIAAYIGHMVQLVQLAVRCFSRAFELMT